MISLAWFWLNSIQRSISITQDLEVYMDNELPILCRELQMYMNFYNVYLPYKLNSLIFLSSLTGQMLLILV